MKQPSENLLQSLASLEAPSECFAAVSAPIRLKALYLLATRVDLTVDELAAQLGSRAARLSYHLAKLRLAGLITSDDRRPTRFYRLVDHPFNSFLRSSIWAELQSLR